MLENYDKLRHIYNKGAKAKHGFVNLNQMVENSTKEALQEFCALHKIALPDAVSTKAGIYSIILQQYQDFESEKTRLEDLGYHLLEIPSINAKLIYYDYIARSELIEVFADYCADMGINTFNAPENNHCDVNLYLTKKTPILRTETVFILPGVEVDGRYDNILANMDDCEKIADWKILVTTPLGVLRIGLSNLLEHMKKRNAWLYVVDPVSKKIFGVTKGGKSKQKNEQMQNDFIRNLPVQPIRALSQVVKISKYAFSERHSYHPKNFKSFYLPESYTTQIELYQMNQKYAGILTTLLIIGNDTGLPMYSYSAQESKVDELMVSGFLTALNSFVQEISGGGGLQEIDYHHFKINAKKGENVQFVVLTTESVDDAFRQRLQFLLTKFEIRFAKSIERFVKTGNVGGLDQDLILQFIKPILLI